MQAEPDHEKRARAVDALARGATKSAAARASGYARFTIQRLMRDVDFLADVARRRADLGEPAPAPVVRSTTGLSDARVDELERKALDHLEAVVAGTIEASPATRASAAKALAAHAARERQARARPGLAPTVDATITGPAAAPPPAPSEPAGRGPALRVLDPLSPEAKADADAWLAAQGGGAG